jgi:hypothetical protein
MIMKVVDPNRPDSCHICGGTGLAWNYYGPPSPVFGLCAGCGGLGVRIVLSGESRPTIVGTLEYLTEQ